MPRVADADPFRGFNFRVEIDGITAGSFSEVSGLQVEMEVEDYREGGGNDHVHKLAGPTRYPSNLTLKRGMMNADDLNAWQEEVMSGAITLRNVSVVLLDLAGEEARRWDLKEAYPVRWNGPDLRGTSNEVAVETLELVHKGLM